MNLPKVEEISFHHVFRTKYFKVIVQSFPASNYIVYINLEKLIIILVKYDNQSCHH